MAWEKENRRKQHKKRGNQRVIYFTSDLHLRHRGIITMQNRPFKTVEEMNRILIQNFNACVGKGDTVCILGDICHHMPVEAANDTISSLHGTKYLVKRNHDKKYAEGLFEDICDFKVTSLNGEAIVLMHYPMMSWPKSRRTKIGFFLTIFSFRVNIVIACIRRGVDKFYGFPKPLG